MHVSITWSSGLRRKGWASPKKLRCRITSLLIAAQLNWWNAEKFLVYNYTRTSSSDYTMPKFEKQRVAVAWSAPCLAKDTKRYRMIYQQQERRTIPQYIPASPLYLPSCNSYFLKGAATVMVLYSAYLVLLAKSARSTLRVYSFCWVTRCRKWFPSLQIKSAVECACRDRTWFDL